MKYLILAIILISSIYSQRQKCVSVSCVCVDKDTAMLIKPNCPNEKLNTCLEKVRCSWLNGKCQYNKSGERRCERQNALPPCVRGGCSNELCTEQTPSKVSDAISICLYDPKFECYNHSECERQANGQCGWTENESLNDCLKGH